MRYVKLENGLPVEVSKEYPKGGPGVVWARSYVNNQKVSGILANGNGWISTRDCATFEEATALAAYVTAITGKIYLPTDASEAVSPRYDIMEAPQVGDAVSYTFNGDSYPCGYISKITKTWQITTTTGAKFRRPGNAPGWRKVGGTWQLISGHHDERNPSF